MTTAQKLQLKPGQRIRLIDPPEDLSLDVPDAEHADIAEHADGDAVLLFVRDLGALRRDATKVTEPAAADRLTWIAYPKGGQLGTDLTRDVIRDFMHRRGVEAVRQVALDGIWSALRLRPGDGV